MPRFFPRKSHKIGLAPGSLVPVDVPSAEPVRIQVMDYDAEGVREEEAASLAELVGLTETPTVSWINVDGLHEVEEMEILGERFGLHPLVLEDVLNTEQRSKLEEYEDHLFLVVKMLSFDPAARQLREEQISLLLSRGVVISLQERPGDVFDPVRQRIRTGRGRIRRMEADYLAYALLDAIVDHYFLVLERIGDWVEEVEEEVVDEPARGTLEKIHELKKETLLLRRAVWPTREVAHGLQRTESPLMSEPVRLYVRDVYDHAVQLIDTVETLRDLVAGIRDTYLSSVSNRMNEIMKVLTVMASVFIPLTFIAGVYGMNFRTMPELSWPWGYPAVLALMAVVAGGMLVFFRARDWI